MLCNVYYPASQQNVAHCIGTSLQNEFNASIISEEHAPSETDLQWSDYDYLDWDLVTAGKRANSYPVRKALIRKNHLANTVKMYAAKRDTILSKYVPDTYVFDLTFLDELDELLMDDLYDLAQSLRENESSEEKQWWILKPAFTSGGDGIELFSTLEGLETILGKYELSDDEGDEAFSSLRQWVAQKYIQRPLILKNRPAKFHLRVYVLAVGALQVYVHVPFNALFAADAYREPTNDTDMRTQLTNTCAQGLETNEEKERVVFLWPDVANESQLSALQQQKIQDTVVCIVGDLFRAAQSTGSGFQTYEQCFEIFGVDFVLDEDYCPYLLEVNACPDFGQLPQKQMWVVQDLFDSTAQILNQKEPKSTLVRAM